MREIDVGTRMAALERKVDALYRHLGIAPPAPSTAVSPEVHALLAQGNKIEAIKRYREETGAGLAEAKDAVEAAERGIP